MRKDKEYDQDFLAYFCVKYVVNGLPFVFLPILIKLFVVNFRHAKRDRTDYKRARGCSYTLPFRNE